jgi:uridine phosphorylase
MGEPARVEATASYLQATRVLWDTRSFLAIQGVYKDNEVVICSHGIGPSSASMVFEQLFRAGVQTIIRAGTSGSLSPIVQPYSLVIATAAIRDDGVSSLLVPIEFPAQAQPHVIAALQTSAEAYPELTVHTGLVWSSGIFYPSQYGTNRASLWTKLGALAAEMELATLFITSAMHSASAGGIVAVEGGVEENLDPWSGHLHTPEMESLVNAMLRISLDALIKVPS